MSNQRKINSLNKANAALLRHIKTLRVKHDHALTSKALGATSDGPAMMNKVQKNVTTKKSAPKPESSQSK